MVARCILYLSGGTMRGVFGAGVVTALQEAGAYDGIEAIYASSGGALTGAYFLARQTRLGSSIYYEDLVKDFISVRNFWGGMYDRIEDRFFYHLPEYRVRDALDLDYLFRVVEKVKPLDLSAVVANPIPIMVKVFDLKERRAIYLSLKTNDPLKVLRASATMVPYVHRTVTIEGHQFTDANIIEPIGFAELRKRHPESKIVVVFSGDAHSKMTSDWKNYIEGFFAYTMYGSPFYSIFAHARANLEKELREIRSDPKALFVAAPKDSPTLCRTTNPKKLKTTYQMGIDAGIDVVRFIGGSM